MKVLLGYLISIPAILITIGMHEFIKALVSTKLGDTLPKKEGRLTLNFFKHIDPFGFFVMLFTGLGWSKPVDTSALYYKNRKRDTVIVYVMPIITNVIIAILFANLAKIFWGTITNYYDVTYYIGVFLTTTAEYNILFALMNLIPIFPYCASKILNTFVSPQMSITFTRYEKILQLVLLFLIFGGYMMRFLLPIGNLLIGLAS